MFRKTLLAVSAGLIFSLSGCGGGGSITSNKVKVELPSYLNYKCKAIENPEIITFCIKSDDTYESIGKTETDTEIALLNKILTIFPRRMRERIVEIEFGSEDFAEGSAAVSPVDAKKTQWGMWVNTNSVAMSDEKGQMESVAHEIKHYLTLNNTQEGSDTSICGSMMGMLGTCPAGSSVYFDFIKQFWEPIYNDKIWPNGDYNGYYDTHQNDFVTPYAVTDSGEDIAESFSEFIYQDKPTDLSLIKNKKIDYFWQFSEFVALREEIRRNIGNVLGIQL